jgi:hypothetical protein
MVNGQFRNEAIDKIPLNIVIHWNNIRNKVNLSHIETSDSLSQEHKVIYVPDNELREHFLVGTDEGLPILTSTDSVHRDQDSDTDPEAWLKNVDHQHITDSDWT